MTPPRRQVPLPTFVAELPYRLGFQFGDQDVVMIALGEHGNVIVQAVLEWAEVRAGLQVHSRTEVSDADVAQELTASVVASTATAKAHQFAVVGYGPHGRDRAVLVAEALLQSPYRPPAPPIPVHVNAGAVSLLHHQLQQWSSSQLLPDVSAAAVLNGMVAPAHTRADVAALHAPAPSPLFAPIPPTSRPSWQPSRRPSGRRSPPAP